MTFFDWLRSLFGKPSKPVVKPVETPPVVPAPVVPADGPWGPMRTKGEPIKVYPVKGAVPGIDVSPYQPKVKWDLVVKRGFKFCFAKASDGDLTAASTFNTHRENAHKHGLLFGAYHFFRFQKDPTKQAKLLLQMTGGVRVGELPFVLDLEWDKQSARYGPGNTMDDSAANRALEFLFHIDAETGMAPIIYTSWPFFKGFEAPERFFRYPLWCPAYQVDAPKVPLPWSRWAFWQTADQPSFAREITGDPHLDTNLFNGSYEELKAMTRKP